MQQLEQRGQAMARENPHFRVRSPIQGMSRPPTLSQPPKKAFARALCQAHYT